jgi:hypothetical protein
MISSNAIYLHKAWVSGRLYGFRFAVAGETHHSFWTDEASILFGDFIPVLIGGALQHLLLALRCAGRCLAFSDPRR